MLVETSNLLQMARLYHATMKELTLGAKLTCGTATSFTDPYRRAAEELLEGRRPDGRPKRLSSWFACDTARLSGKYLDAQLSFGFDNDGRNRAPRLFAIEMDSSSKQPMILVNAVAKKLSEGEANIAGLLAGEYWTPALPWSFWEYISPELTVLEEQPWPGAIELAIAHLAYTADSNLLKRFLSGGPLVNKRRRS
jgi:hypothetical protein